MWKTSLPPGVVALISSVSEISYFGFWPTTSFIVMARQSVHLLNIGSR
jgi:hypothetical protein